MREPIHFICSNCGKQIPALSSGAHKMFDSVDTQCTYCTHIITKDDVLEQVKTYCMQHFHKEFGYH